MGSNQDPLKVNEITGIVNLKKKGENFESSF